MRILTALFSFVLFGLIARSWGPERLGEYSTIFTYFIFLMQFPLLGLHIVVARDIAACHDDIGRYITASSVLSLFISFIIALMVVAIGWWGYGAQLHEAFFILALTCFPTAIIVSIESALIGREKMTLISKVNIIESVIRTVLSTALVAIDAPLVLLVAVLLFGRLIALALYLVEVNKVVNWGANLFDSSLLKSLVKQAPLFFGILVFSASIGKLDLIFLSLWGGGMHDVGIYSAAFKIYEVGVMVPAMISVVLFPIFSRLYAHSLYDFAQQFSIITRIVCGIGLPFTIATCLFSPILLPLIFGAQYEESVFLFQLLCGAIFCTALDQLLSIVLLAAKQEKLELKVLAITFIIYMISLAYFIPHFGSLGAALATLIALVLKVFVRYYYARTIIGVTLVDLKMPPLLSAGIVMILLQYWISNLVLAILMGFVVYIVVMVLLKGITSNDLKQLSVFFTRDDIKPPSK